MQTRTRRARPGEARAWLEHHIANFHTAEDINACVLWPFSTNGGKGGKYPQIRIDGQTMRATRHVWECVTGQRLAVGELIRHCCDLPTCVNPWHFEIGDHAANMRDMTTRQRSAAGERNGNARLTAVDVRRIRQRAADGIHYGDVSNIARDYGVTPQAIALILAGETWRDTLGAQNITQQRADTLASASR